MEEKFDPKTLLYKNENAFAREDREELKKSAADYCVGYKKFLDNGKTERECVTETVAAAKAAGYIDLNDAIKAGKALKPGDKVYGPVLCGRVEAVKSTDGGYDVRVNDGTVTRAAKTACSNLHEGDLVAYNTKSDTICTLEDLHAEQKEFPHCIADGIFILQEEDAEPGLNMAHILGFDDSIVEFEITPNRFRQP